MPLAKKLLKAPATQALLAWLLSSYIRFVYLTSRKTFRFDNASRIYMQGGDNAIFAFWHGRIMMCPAICPPKRPMRVLISHHRDGLLISQVIGHFNQKTVSGSTSRGGKAAMMEMLTALERGDNISITPDGPRGPAQIATRGVVTLARLSQKPVLPVTFSAGNARRLSSWDRFMLARPFGRLVFCVGAPLVVHEESNEEAARLDIEQTMNALVETADEAARG